MNLGGTVHINKKGFFVLIFFALILFFYLFSHGGDIKTTVNKINIKKLLAVAIQAAEAGGREVVRIRNNLKIESKGKTKEGANDSVTTADYMSHCVMLNSFMVNFPTLQVISEEVVDCKDQIVKNHIEVNNVLNDELVNENDVKVWIDPLDATQEYTEKLYEYVTTMVCVAVNGVPVLGVIHKPFLKTTSWAWVGKSNTFDGLKPPVRDDKMLKFIVSRSHSGKVKETITKVFSDKTVEIIPAGGAGYKVLEVINGNADAYVHVTAIKKWDICAGNAILNALGGRMTTKENSVIDYSDSDHVVNENGLIATLRNHQFYVDKFK